MDTILGKGTFGCVILSVSKNSEVAVKKIKSSHDPKYIYREMKMMDEIRYSNLISTIGVCSTESYFYIIMEYFRSKTLGLIISSQDKDLTYQKKKNENYYIALQICKAINFLHEFNPTVLHKDIKPDNIFINKSLAIKICDFGMSKICDGSSALETTVEQYFHRTPFYMAPEILINHEKGNTSSDV